MSVRYLISKWNTVTRGLGCGIFHIAGVFISSPPIQIYLNNQRFLNTVFYYFLCFHH
jgi:hypothetical protein